MLVNNTLEAIGILLLVAFAFVLWPPAALAAAGVVLVVVANVRAARASRTDRPRLSERLARALAAYRGTTP